MEPRYFITFYKTSATNDKKLVGGLGSDSMSHVDNRLSLFNMRLQAIRQAKSLKKAGISNYTAYSIVYGTIKDNRIIVEPSPIEGQKNWTSYEKW